MSTERNELITYIYEGHKDAYGVKGRHYDFDAMSTEQLRAEADRISDAVGQAIDQERAQEQQDLQAFRDDVDKFISYGAGDRATALRWMTQDETFYHRQCVEHWVWNRGILFTDEGRELVNELVDIVTFEDWDTE